MPDNAGVFSHAGCPPFAKGGPHYILDHIFCFSFFCSHNFTLSSHHSSTCATPAEFHALVQRNLAASAGASTAGCARLLAWGATRVPPPFASPAAAMAAAVDARAAAGLADVLVDDAEQAGDGVSAGVAREAAETARQALAAAQAWLKEGGGWRGAVEC